MLCHQQCLQRCDILAERTKVEERLMAANTQAQDTYIVHLELGARVAHTFKDLLDLGQKT